MRAEAQVRRGGVRHLEILQRQRFGRLPARWQHRAGGRLGSRFRRNCRVYVLDE